MARDDGDNLKEVNRRLTAALRDCEEQLERARQMLRKTRQDKDRQFTD